MTTPAARPTEAEDDAPMTSQYVRVLVVELVVLIGLWWLSRQFS
ncbi:MAG: hypothetical protein AB7I50_03215 [Vicinamibacterales bacterium]